MGSEHSADGVARCPTSIKYTAGHVHMSEESFDLHFAWIAWGIGFVGVGIVSESLRISNR